VKAFRPRSSNAVEAAANLGSDLRDQVRQAVQPEQRMLRRRQLYTVRRRSQNMVIQQRDDQARSQVPGKVDRGRFRRRIAIKDFSVNDSVRRRLRAQVNTGSPAEGHRLDFVNTLRRRVVVVRLRADRTARAKEGRAPMASRPRRNMVARLLRLSITKASRKVENKSHRRKPRRPSHNNSAGIFGAPPERTIPEPLLFNDTCREVCAKRSELGCDGA